MTLIVRPSYFASPGRTGISVSAVNSTPRNAPPPPPPPPPPPTPPFPTPPSPANSPSPFPCSPQFSNHGSRVKPRRPHYLKRDRGPPPHGQIRPLEQTRAGVME